MDMSNQEIFNCGNRHGCFYSIVHDDLYKSMFDNGFYLGHTVELQKYDLKYLFCFILFPFTAFNLYTLLFWFMLLNLLPEKIFHSSLSYLKYNKSLKIISTLSKMASKYIKLLIILTLFIYVYHLFYQYQIL